MKDSRFIELVNLYIDRQITAAETAELEAEIQENPKRRAIYRQYCQLHAATKQVYASFRSPAQPSAGQPATHAAVTRFNAGRRANRYGWVNYAGGLAAAACLALIFVRYNQSDSRKPEALAQSDAKPVVTATVPESAPAARVAAAPAVQAATSLASSEARKSLASEPDYAAMLAALRQEDQRAFANGQMQPARIQSLFDDGVFDTQQVLPANNPRVFRSKHSPAQQAEFTAFQFQR